MFGDRLSLGIYLESLIFLPRREEKLDFLATL